MYIRRQVGQKLRVGMDKWVKVTIDDTLYQQALADANMEKSDLFKKPSKLLFESKQQNT
jgi:hypothetical protein